MRSIRDSRTYYEQIWLKRKRRDKFEHCLDRFTKFVINTDWEGAPQNSSITRKISNNCTYTEATWLLEYFKSVGGQCTMQANSEMRYRDSWGKESYQRWSVFVTIYPNTRTTLLDKGFQNNDGDWDLGMHGRSYRKKGLVKGNQLIGQLLIIADTALYLKLKSLGLPKVNCIQWILPKSKEDYEINNIPLTIYLYSTTKLDICRRTHVSKMEGYSPHKKSETEVKEEINAALSDGDSYVLSDPSVEITNVACRKSERIKTHNLRKRNQNSDIGTYKRWDRYRNKKHTSLSCYISPAPIHWKILSCKDYGVLLNENDEKNKGRFRIKLKGIKNPMKEALVKIGEKTFDLDMMLDVLSDIENDKEIKRTKPAKKRLKQELMAIRGCYLVSHDVEQVVEFNASDFIKNLKGFDKEKDVCYVCGKCGELLYCDGCPHVFHLICVGLNSVPDEKWYCSDCVEGQKKMENNAEINGEKVKIMSTVLGKRKGNNYNVSEPPNKRRKFSNR
eukprot:264070_1